MPPGPHGSCVHVTYFARYANALVFLTDMRDFKGFDEEWRAWLPEGIGASRATVGVASLANNDKVEIKVTVAA